MPSAQTLLADLIRLLDSATELVPNVGHHTKARREQTFEVDIRAKSTHRRTREHSHIRWEDEAYWSTLRERTRENPKLIW